jgi:hypothetical protein
MLELPREIIYEIMDWLDPFDILNICYICKINPNRKYYLYKDKQISRVCNGDNYFINVIDNIIDKIKFIDYNIISILDSIICIIKKTSKYMDILGFNTYVFNIHKGSNFISRHAIPIIYKDTQIINIYYQDIDVLKYYLENFMNFKIDVKIKKYNMKFIMTYEIKKRSLFYE